MSGSFKTRALIEIETVQFSIQLMFTYRLVSMDFTWPVKKADLLRFYIYNANTIVREIK